MGPAALRFLFVDRILAHEPRERVRAEHVVGPAGVVDAGPYRLLEALAQSAGWLIAASTGFAKRGLPLSITSVRLPAVAPAPSTVLLEAEVLAWREDSALARASASVDGTIVAAIERGICALVPAGELDDPDTTREMFRDLTTAGAGSPPARGGDPPHGWPPAPTLADTAATEDGVGATAVWRIDPAAPFFPDHFPRFPVVPGALQLQALVGLAETLFAGGQRRPVLVALKEARFRGFIRPGEEVSVEARMTSTSGATGAVATAQGFVGGKRVASIGEIHFRLEPVTS